MGRDGKGRDGIGISWARVGGTCVGRNRGNFCTLYPVGRPALFEDSFFVCTLSHYTALHCTALHSTTQLPVPVSAQSNMAGFPCASVPPSIPWLLCRSLSVYLSPVSQLLPSSSCADWLYFSLTTSAHQERLVGGRRCLGGPPLLMTGLDKSSLFYGRSRSRSFWVMRGLWGRE